LIVIFSEKLQIIREIYKEFLEVVDTEDIAVAYLAIFPGGK